MYCIKTKSLSVGGSFNCKERKKKNILLRVTRSYYSHSPPQLIDYSLVNHAGRAYPEQRGRKKMQIKNEQCGVNI